MLSGGQRSMLAMARALMLKPAVMLLDEPSAGLSPLLQAALWEQIERISATGVGICVVEHNLPFIERTCQQVVVMDLGEVIAQGPFSGLRDNPRVVDAYLGMDQSHG